MTGFSGLRALFSKAPRRECQEPARILTVGSKIGPYKLTRELGAGGWGYVYLAHIPNEPPVVIKVPKQSLGHSDLFDRFSAEVTCLANLSHRRDVTNIVRFIAFHRDRLTSLPALVMEYLAGGSLRKQMHARRISPREACLIVSGAARGAHCLHRFANRVHRDIKPENILLDGNEAKLADLGLAHLFQKAAGIGIGGMPEVVTPGFMLKGSKPYNAPELEAGDEDGVGPCSDVYSLAVVLHELLTGQLPGPSAYGLVHAVTPNIAPFRDALPPSISARLEGLIRRCLDSDPALRHQTAEELAMELKEIVGLFGPDAPAVLTKSKTEKRRTLSKTWRTALFTSQGLLVVCALALGISTFMMGIALWKRGFPFGERIVFVAQQPDLQQGQQVLKSGPVAVQDLLEPVEDFVSCHALRMAPFNAWLQKTPAQYRLHWLDVQEFGGTTLFSAIATTDSRPRTVKIRVHILDDGNDHRLITEDWERMTSSSLYRPVWDWRYSEDGHTYRSRIWTNDRHLFRLWHGNEGEIRALVQKCMNDGGSISAITPDVSSLPPHFILTTDSQSRNMRYSLSATYHDLVGRAKGLLGQDWSLDQVTRYVQDGDERFIVLESSNANKPARRFELNILEKDLDARIAVQRQSGYMPWCMTAYEDGSEHHYAVIWSPFKLLTPATTLPLPQQSDVCP